MYAEDTKTALAYGYFLYDNFIKSGAPHQINIAAKFRKEVENDVKLNLLDCATFNHCQEEILLLMSKDSFSRYKKSAYFEDYKHTMLNKKKLSGSIVRAGSIKYTRRASKEEGGYNAVQLAAMMRNDVSIASGAQTYSASYGETL